MKRIDKCRHEVIFVLHDEVSGQTDTMNSAPKAARNLDVHNRQRNRDADALGEHLIQATVSRMVILLLVALKSEFLEQIVVHRVNELLATCSWTEPLTQLTSVGV